MKGVKYFQEQSAAIKRAIGFIESLPPDTEWSFWVDQSNDDAVLNIFILPDETKVYRAMLGLHNYHIKEKNYITYRVDNLSISLIEPETP